MKTIKLKNIQFNFEIVQKNGAFTFVCDLNKVPKSDRQQVDAYAQVLSESYAAMNYDVVGVHNARVTVKGEQTEVLVIAPKTVGMSMQ
tara:strand:- start:5580 stop:5843 length:264 start_codon:yes stop_codon:yes gene_type:complete